MMRQDAHLTLRAGKDDNVHIAFKDHAVLGNDFTSNGHAPLSLRSMQAVLHVSC